MRSEKAQKLKFILVLELQKVRFLLTRSVPSCLTKGCLTLVFSTPLSIFTKAQLSTVAKPDSIFVTKKN